MTINNITDKQNGVNDMADNDEKDPLSDLLIDSDQVDRERLAKSLKNYVGIDSKSGKVVFKPKFQSLSSRQQVLGYLMGNKVAFLLGKAEKEEVAAKDIVNNSGIPKGTVYPKLKELKEERLISQVESSKQYFVDSHQVLSAINEIEKSGGKND